MTPKEPVQESGAFQHLEDVLDALTYSNKLNAMAMAESEAESVSITYIDKWEISILMSTDHDLNGTLNCLLRGVYQLICTISENTGTPKQQVINDVTLALVKLAKKNEG